MLVWLRSSYNFLNMWYSFTINRVLTFLTRCNFWLIILYGVIILLSFLGVCVSTVNYVLFSWTVLRRERKLFLFDLCSFEFVYLSMSLLCKTQTESKWIVQRLHVGVHRNIVHSHEVKNTDFLSGNF